MKRAAVSDVVADAKRSGLPLWEILDAIAMGLHDAGDLVGSAEVSSYAAKVFGGHGLRTYGDRTFWL